jgi:hypothetical protein
VRTDFVPAALPKPGTAQQSSEDRPAVCAVGLAKSYGADRVVVIAAGRKIADGPPAAI